MSKDEQKKAVAKAAINYVQPGMILGIGTGSTVSYFIDELSFIKKSIKGVISSSKLSTKKLRRYGIQVLNLNLISKLSLYIDGADEINLKMQMIKGGGAALTCEKIIAAVSEQFICIVDSTKIVENLGKKFPLPVEVIPMARNYVTHELLKLGGLPKHRSHVITDNGNIIIDVYNLNIVDPIEIEKTINQIAGVVTVGIFASRCADIVLISDSNGIRTLKK